MIPLAWIEPIALTTGSHDPYGSLRHHWQVVYRCPRCNTLESDYGPLHLIHPGDGPAPPLLAHTELLAELIERHHCPEGPDAS